MNLGGRICLADEKGPFGNPTSDSARASISEKTRRALVVIFAPYAMKQDLLARRLDQTVERVSRFTGARHIGE